MKKNKLSRSKKAILGKAKALVSSRKIHYDKVAERAENIRLELLDSSRRARNS
ncbi:MAG: hypothetical protein OQJ89_08505 [Kangiellaceae bacterium]|nr:hypothetical protein [Kangiellaceae bacterium]MCW9016990.1 hypothetical protein [Kangiellaceae bacterium]